MKLPRDLDGRILVKVSIRDWDDQMVHLEESRHLIQAAAPARQRPAVPDHSPLQIRTLNAILRLAATHKEAGWEDIRGRS